MRTTSGKMGQKTDTDQLTVDITFQISSPPREPDEGKNSALSRLK